MEPLNEFEDKSSVWREMRLLNSTEMKPVIPEPKRFKPITCFWLTSHVIPFYLHTWVVGDQFFMAPNGSTSSDLILRSKLVSVASSASLLSVATKEVSSVANNRRKWHNQ